MSGERDSLDAATDSGGTKRIPVGGGTPEVLLRNLSTGSESVCPGFLSVDGTAAYWFVEFTTDDIRKQVF